MTPAGIHWFPGLGFRPAVWTPPHRADRADPDRLIVAPDADTAYAAKYAPLADIDPLAPLGNWGTVLPPLPAQASGPDAVPAGAAGTAQAGGWWPASAPPVWWTPLPPPDVGYPCRCITTPPAPDLPPMAPVPVSADAALLLATGMVALVLARLSKGLRHD